jgi:hypothetical protein
MQVIAPSRAPRPANLVSSLVLGSIVGVVLLGGGVLLAYLTLGTSFLHGFTPTGRATDSQLIAGAIAWSFALTAPALFAIVGLVRLLGVVELANGLRARPSRTSRLAGALSDEYVVAVRVPLPDGRIVPEIVLGPFGVAVVAELPPPGATRRHGGAWEVRLGDGRWRPMEDPLERAARDGERVRRWLEQDDRDHVVKVYAVLLAPDGLLQRTPGCAVVAPDQLSAWIASLPPQRSLTPSRRANLVALVREAV